jgi:hypothetical protein
MRHTDKVNTGGSVDARFLSSFSMTHISDPFFEQRSNAIVTSADNYTVE